MTAKKDNQQASNANQIQTSKLVSVADYDDEGWQFYEDPQGFIELINPVEDVLLDPQQFEVLERELPFYHDVKLVSVHNLHTPEEPEDELNYFFLQHDNDIVMLKGHGEYIHEMNDTGTLKITSDNVCDYLKFFAAFSPDEDTLEPFLIVEGAESEFLQGFNKVDRKRILKNYSGPRIIAEANQKRFMIETRMIYAGDLYEAKFKITKDGDVAMLDDKFLRKI